MNTISSVELPVAKKKNVVVVGGGPAGVLAAIAAARNGADTMLIERVGYLGGMLTGGLVHSLHGYRMNRNYINGLPMSNWEPPLMVKGISLEIIDRLQKAEGTLDQGRPGIPSVRENYDAEILIEVLDEMMEEAGVEILFNTIAFGAIKEGNTVTGVMIANKSGGQVISADMVIDASADADIATNAGVEYRFGDDTNHRTHGGAVLMEVGGIDVDKYLNYLKTRPEKTAQETEAFNRELEKYCRGGKPRAETILDLDGKTGYFAMPGKKQSWEQIEKARKDGQYLMLPPIDQEWVEYLKTEDVPHLPNTVMGSPVYPPGPRHSWYGIVRQGKLRYDQTMSGIHEVFFDQSNEEEVSKAILYMRKINRIYMHFLQSRIPGFENAYISKTSPLVGTRESRRIVGEYILTGEDCVNGAKFEDAVALSGRACNVHNMDGAGGTWYWLEPKDEFQIPYRVLVPAKIDNLLVAGRCSSVDFIALGATRSMPTCMTLGEAAGTAAALAVSQGSRARDVNIKQLQKALKAQGVLLSLD